MLQQETFEELGSCELGTKEYWDISYDKEINNYLAHGDTGEIWFEESQQFKIITWILKCDGIEESDSLIDLGKNIVIFGVSMGSTINQLF